jgi:hypothetical protein
VVPTWTLAIAAVAGVAVGVVVGRLIPRPKPPVSEAAASQEPAVAAAGVPVGSTTAEGEPAAAEVPRIGMEDVVTELERRYQGRRADEERERARRKRDAEPPPSQR